MNMLHYEFMQRALIVSGLLSVLIPLIGVVIVLKRLSAMGEALSHTSLAGVAVGLVAGLNPIIVATLFSILASLSIEFFRKAFPKYAEISTNIVLSAGIGLAAVFSSMVKNSAGFNSFLFGSLVAISKFDVWLIASLSLIVIVIRLFLYKDLLYITLDEESARISGVPVGQINLLFTIMTAVTVSIASRTVGALMVSSLVVIPVACAMLLAKSYKQTVIFSIGFALLFTMSGLTSSFYLDLRPGGTIVLIGVGVLLLLLAGKSVTSKIKR